MNFIVDPDIETLNQPQMCEDPIAKIGAWNPRRASRIESKLSKAPTSVDVSVFHPEDV
jgi:hypothetical protein